MKTLYCGDLGDLEDLKNLLMEFTELSSWKKENEPLIEKEAQEILDKYYFIIAHKWEGGYEESAYFLLLEKETKKYYTVYASHCSCYGFEGQFDVTPFSLEKGYESIKHEISNSEYETFINEYLPKMLKGENE